MSRNNQMYSKGWTTSDITESTISSVWDFMEEAFTGLTGVTFQKNSSDKVMYIYLDDEKKMYIAVKVNAANQNTGVLIEYWLNSEQCTYKDTLTQTKTIITYVRTEYGIAWGCTSNSASYSDLGNVFVQKTTPTMFVGIKQTGMVSNTYYILSPLHDQIESMSESSMYIAGNLGEQKFIMTNAYSCLEKLKLRHFFRVLGIPGSNYPQGRIKVGDRNLFWFGRFALEEE